MLVNTILTLRYPRLCGDPLELIAIPDGFQGKNLGSNVLGWMAKEARGVCPNLWTTVSAFNHRAVGFYQRRGFEQVTILRDFLKKGEDEILLRCSRFSSGV